MKVCINIVKYGNKLVRAGSLGICAALILPPLILYTQDLNVAAVVRMKQKMSSYQNCRIFLEASTNCAVVCLSLTLFNDHLTAVDIGLIGDGVSTLNTSNYTHARLSSLVRPFIKNER